jgi:serine/threonine-protein kinase
MTKRAPPPPSFRKILKKAKQRAESATGAIGPGSVLGERYEVLRELGKGAFGAVYQATDRTTGGSVAVKVLHDHVVSDQVKTRMRREAHAMKQLEDTCAVGIHDFNEMPGGQLYLVMEFLDGQNLQQLIESYDAQGQRMAPHQIGVTLRPIVDTLRVAHERKIIHRDLKPENIFVLREGGANGTRLLDFGLVKDLSLEKLTAAGMVAGSPSYIAPESWAGLPDKLDHRIDIYSLGVIVYRILTGTVPFKKSENMLEFIMTVTQAPRPSVVRHRPDLHESVDLWTQKALAIKPEDRFQTVQELWEGLGYVFSQSG